MLLPRQGSLGRLGYQVASRVPARCFHNAPRVQFITGKLRPLSTCTGNGLGIYAQNTATLRRGFQNLGNPATLHASYSTIPDSYPRNPAAWSRWVVKLLLHWDGMFELPLVFRARHLLLWCWKIQKILN